MTSPVRSDVRLPAVAGSFYPSDPVALRRLVQECLAGVADEERRADAAIAPHAGLIYSGKCAGEVFGRLSFPRTVVILAPNHTGRCDSPGASLWRSGAFETPLGQVAIDEAFVTRLEHECDLVRHDPVAHRFEHAIEVELPFLQTVAPQATIAPLVLAWDDWQRCERLAAAMAAAISATAHEVLLLASSDMTHYESADAAQRKDRIALAAIERLDGRALLDACARERISMCGRAPAAVAIEAARRLGATSAEVVDYRNSGLVTGDNERVVGYAGVVISKDL
jgi:hypothetical protein